MQWTDSHESVRVYDDLVASARTIKGDRESRMHSAVDALWESLCALGLSWIGFYEIAREGNEHGAEPGGAMVLGPHRDKPACSPIGLHGACGQAWLGRRTLVITDVTNLGRGYVACDPRDRSELVIPCFAADGSCWGVLDADSFEADCFDIPDAVGLTAFLVASGLSAERKTPIEVI